MTTFEEHIKEMVATAQHANDFPKDSPVRQLAESISNVFSEHVDFLRSQVPNKVIRELGALLWELVGHRVTRIAIAPEVKTLSFLGYRDAGVRRGQILVPEAWVSMVIVQPLVQMGAVVNMGSKAIDIYNDRLDNIHNRALAYEAEFLHTLLRDAPAAPLNDYQKEVIRDFPQGIESADIKNSIYKSKPFFAAEA